MEEILWLGLVLILWQICEFQRSYWAVLFDRDLLRAFWQGNGIGTASVDVSKAAAEEDRREYQPPRGAA